MIRKSFLLLASFCLLACSNFGSKKTKDIVELTTKLFVENPEKIILSQADLMSYDFNNIKKNKPIILTKNNIISEPFFTNNILYGVDSKGVVFAFSIKDKKHLWLNNITKKPYNQKHAGGGIEYFNEKLYITNGSRFLTILDAKTGYEIVRKEFPDIIKTKPVMFNNLILIKTVSNQLFAYDISTSKIVWQHEGVFEVLSSTYHPEPLIYNDYVIVSYSSGQIVVLDCKTGAEKWSINLSNNNDIGLPNFESSTVLTKPIIHGKYTYIASSTNELLKIDIITGDIIWRVAASDIQSMSLLGNNLFITTNARQVAAVNHITGKIIWTADLLSENKKKNKASFLFPPFASKSFKSDANWILNIVTDKGEIYKFESKTDGDLEIIPNIQKIEENILYNLNAEFKLYFITRKQLILAN